MSSPHAPIVNVWRRVMNRVSAGWKLVRRAAKTDASQATIVERLRSCGVWVKPLHAVGGGFPDLLCHARGRFFLMEVKEPGEHINKLQAEFIAACPGEIHIARTEEEALKAALGEEALR